MDQNTKQRLFFALLPGKKEKNDIIQFRKSFKIHEGVKIVEDSKLHITLFFLGEVYENLIPEIIDNMQTIKLKTFTINLDYTGYFSNKRVFWLGCNIIPKQLLQLIDSIAFNLEKIPELELQYLINKKNKYTPHVTLFKRAALGDIQICDNINPAIQWQVNNFYLIRSKNLNNALQYEIVEKF